LQTTLAERVPQRQFRLVAESLVTQLFAAWQWVVLFGGRIIDSNHARSFSISLLLSLGRQPSLPLPHALLSRLLLLAAVMKEDLEFLVGFFKTNVESQQLTKLSSVSLSPFSLSLFSWCFTYPFLFSQMTF
jgi:hypothetical protein